MHAIILAAGLGSRLGALTEDRPKCLLDLHGEPLIGWQVRALSECGVSTVTVVTGYCGSSIESALGSSVRYVRYPHFAGTNNLLTLHYASHLLHGDVLVLFADVLVPPVQLQRVIAAAGDYALLVDTSVCRPGTMRVRLEGSRLTDIGGHVSPDDGHGNFVGIARYSAIGAGKLRNAIARLAQDPSHRLSYYTAALPALSTPRHPVGIIDIAGAPWLEVDSRADYEAALQHDFYCVAPSARQAITP